MIMDIVEVSRGKQYMLHLAFRIVMLISCVSRNDSMRIEYLKTGERDGLYREQQLYEYEG